VNNCILGYRSYICNSAKPLCRSEY